MVTMTLGDCSGISQTLNDISCNTVSLPALSQAFHFQLTRRGADIKPNIRCLVLIISALNSAQVNLKRTQILH